MSSCNYTLRCADAMESDSSDSDVVSWVSDAEGPGAGIMEIGEAIKNPAYRIFQTEYSGCLDISAHA